MEEGRFFSFSSLNNCERYDNLIENYERIQNIQHDGFFGIHFEIFLHKIVAKHFQNLQKQIREEPSKHCQIKILIRFFVVADIGIQVNSGALIKEKIKLYKLLSDERLKVFLSLKIK